jgi:dTMP kinase
LQRVRQRTGTSTPTDRFEEEPARFFERVRATYLDLARAEPARIRIIDASRELTQVQNQVASALETLLKNTS